MDIYKEKFTKLEKEIFKILSANYGKKLNQRAIALALGVSPTAVAKSIKNLDNVGLIKVNKDKASDTFEIEINAENNRTFFMRRVENLRMIYESGLTEYLFDEFPGATIILFGSYSFGEDTSSSDIDIAIIEGKEKELKLTRFEKIFNKKIMIQFHSGFGSIHKNLRENLFNGIVLKGSVRL